MLAELHHISKAYGTEGTTAVRQVLRDVSLSIDTNEAIAITGPSGSGKSTLLNILGTIDTPTTGNVMINGLDIKTMNHNELAKLRNRFIGFVFQLHHLLPQLTLLENVMLPLLPLKDAALRKTGADHARYLLDRLGLAELSNKFPSRVSVGECQRTALARALVNQPRLLLADEPTGSLDAENAAILGDLLGDLNREHELAVVVVTHSGEMASRMHKIYALTSGSLHLQTGR